MNKLLELRKEYALQVAAFMTETTKHVANSVSEN